MGQQFGGFGYGQQFGGYGQQFGGYGQYPAATGYGSGYGYGQQFGGYGQGFQQFGAAPAFGAQTGVSQFAQQGAYPQQQFAGFQQGLPPAVWRLPAGLPPAV